MPFINCFPIDATTGRAVVVEATATSTDPYLAARRFLPDAVTNDSAYILTGAVPVGAIFQDGFAHDALGNLCALIDDPPAVGSRYYNDGILGDAQGHMCLTAINAIATYMHGWPVDSIGQVCIVGDEPPPGATFNKLLIAGADLEQTFFVGQLRFGVSGSGGGYSTNQAAFLSAHPGRTLQDFSGIAPPGGTAPLPSFSGFVVTGSNATQLIQDSTAPVLDAPFCSLSSRPTDAIPACVTIFTFSPAINAVSFNIAADVAVSVTLAFYNGATQLDLQTVTPAGTNIFTNFVGYAT